MILYPAISTHNHSVSDCSGGWSICDDSNRSWTNVARPCFLLKTDPASEKMGIASLSAVVQWVSWRTGTNALMGEASCSITLILLTVSHSMFICRMLGLWSSSAAETLLSKTYPAHQNISSTRSRSSSSPFCIVILKVNDKSAFESSLPASSFQSPCALYTLCENSFVSN